VTLTRPADFLVNANVAAKPNDCVNLNQIWLWHGSNARFFSAAVEVGAGIATEISVPSANPLSGAGYSSSDSTDHTAEYIDSSGNINEMVRPGANCVLTKAVLNCFGGTIMSMAGIGDWILWDIARGYNNQTAYSVNQVVTWEFVVPANINMGTIDLSTGTATAVSMPLLQSIIHRPARQ
jgi:hypothetical protein